LTAEDAEGRQRKRKRDSKRGSKTREPQMNSDEHK